MREGYLDSKRISSVTDCGPRGVSANRAPVMLIACPGQSLFDPGLDVAFRLPTNCGQLGNDEISRALEHELLAKRKGLKVAQIGQMLEHVSDFEDISGPHLLGEILETIFPIVCG